MFIGMHKALFTQHPCNQCIVHAMCNIKCELKYNYEELILYPCEDRSFSIFLILAVDVVTFTYLFMLGFMIAKVIQKL